MIQLAADYLIFQLADGENVPFSAEAISIELVGEAATSFAPELVQHAAAAVFHYFKTDLDRHTVTVGEFSQALEKVLRGFSLAPGTRPPPAVPAVPESDLRLLVAEAGRTELLFFPRLRDELRGQLRQSPRLLRFRGLRGCVKQLAGARRWSPRCRHLQDQIMEYLRHCLSAETGPAGCTLVVK